MPLDYRIRSKLIVTLAKIVVLSLGFTMSSCKESSNAATNKGVIISTALDSQPVNDDKVKSTIDIKGQDGDLTNEQFENNPPTASRPRFPTPKPSPVPSPAPVQESEGVSQ